MSIPRRCLCLLVLSFALPAFAQDLTTDAVRIDQWLEEASHEFDVPLELLQAIAFVESQCSWRSCGRCGGRCRGSAHRRFIFSSSSSSH